MRIRKIAWSAVITLAVLVGVWSAASPAFAAPCTCSIWAPSATPANVSVNNTSPVELGVKFKADTAGYITGVRFYKASNNTGSHTGNLWKADGTLLARATFTNESSSGWQTVSFAKPVQVTPGAIYVASYFAPNGNYSYSPNYFASQGVTNGPLQALQNGVAGGNGVYRYGSATSFPNSSYISTNYWVDVVFETKAPVQESPILLITTAANKFSSYYTEILRSEGYTFDTADIIEVTPALLASHDIAILGEMPLSIAQATMFSDWVDTGGNLIAMRPDSDLANLAGLTPTATTLANKYLKIDTAVGSVGSGLVDQSIQYHGVADRYTLNGATSVAELFSAASVGVGNPAVSLHSVGTAGGQVAVFSYDLARSVVQTRQGNPAWAGQNRETVDAFLRSDDMFFGAASGDVQSDWVDMNKVAIPQADEQQRLLGNLMTHMNQDKKPLPHFWYLPKGEKAAVIMTADDHAFDGGAQVISRFNRYLQLSPSGCNVSQWECVRATSYFFMNSSMSQAQAANYTNQGFDLGFHLLVNGSSLVNGVPSSTTCGSYNATTMQTYVTQQKAAFVSRYPNIPAPTSNRTHCITWSDWDSGAKVQANNGIRFDTNYYYWPGTWVQDRPGMMNGGGFPMRFASTDGSLIDSYQAMTQMHDEGPVPQTYPYTIDTLLDRALGAEGYYGAFMGNMHTDTPATLGKTESIIASAQSRGVPIVSSKQMLTWLDGRNESKLTNMNWDGASLTFNATVANGAQNLLYATLPVASSNGPLQSISRGSTPVTYTTQTIKGIEYALFPVSTDTYVANYGVDTTAPIVTVVTPANGATNVAANTQVKASFSEQVNPLSITAATFELRDGNNLPVASTVSYDVNTASAVLTPVLPLTLGATYTATVNGSSHLLSVADQSGNALANDKVWSFTVVPQSPPLSLWPPSAVPANAATPEALPVELGVRIRSDVSGYIKSIRFYKGAGNTGTHTGSLWTASGVRLGQATFVNETTSGWQQVNFAVPIPISANTTYIASYFTPSGHYAYNTSYFAGGSQNNGTLHAPASTTTQPNGVYAYGSTSSFPSSMWMQSNYWVDVVFSTAP